MEGWKRKKMEYDTGSVIYAGYNLHTNAPDDDDQWEIIKYTYDGTDIIGIQKSQGTWTDRVSLNW